MTVRREKAEKRARKQEEGREGCRKKVEEGLEKKATKEKRERDEYWKVRG
jgi:ribosome biogenesis protein BMS1